MQKHCFSLLNLSNAVHVQTSLSLQVYKMCWICLIHSIKRKWGTSPCHCRAQHNDARLHTLNLKYQWNSSDAFSSAHVCMVWWITSIMSLQWILCHLWPSTELAFLTAATQPDSKFALVNGKTQHHRQDHADLKPGQETLRKHKSYPVCCLEYLFSVLEFTD